MPALDVCDGVKVLEFCAVDAEPGLCAGVTPRGARLSELARLESVDLVVGRPNEGALATVKGFFEAWSGIVLLDLLASDP